MPPSPNAGSPAAGILEHFASLDDPRDGPATRHELLDIVAIALLAVVCGADTWVEVEQFGKEKRGWLGGFLALPHGIPAHDTFGRVFAALAPVQFEGCFAAWVQAVARLTGGEVVAVDGKVVRRSHDRAGGKAALHLVRAWAAANRLTLGQVAVADGANEIAAIPELLRLLALKGCIVTVDAIGCQTAIARQVLAQEADYALALKDNQEGLHDAVARLFGEERARGFAGLAHDVHRTVEKDHGRLEVRRAWTVSDPAVIAYLNGGGAGRGGAASAWSRRNGGRAGR